MGGKKQGVYVPCEYCGKIVYKPPYQYKMKEHHFCSLKCQGKHKTAMTHEHRSCEYCGGDMYVSKKSKLRFCSPKCQSEWQKGNVGIKNAKFEGKVLPCDNCGKEISVGKSDIRLYKHHFCSDDCRKEWYNNVCSQTEEWREASRIRASKQQVANPKNTKPQVMINDALDKMNIKYENEKHVKYYSLDNYLTDYNLAIEVMGDYWHTNPIKYTTKINDMQRKNITKDKAKNTYVKRYYNINILYLWETDIYKNIELCKKLIQKYIDSNGELDNYHSFNYELDEQGEIKLKEELIIPYQQRKKIAC